MLRKRIAAAALFLALVAPARGWPQAELAINDLQVALWPEYDRPAVLVICQIELIPLAALPAKVSFRIPLAAGEPNAVAELQPDGRLITLAYDRRLDGEWAVIEFTAERPNVQIEYYDPGIERDGAARAFSYTWPGDYSVGNFEMRVQQPVGATEVTIVPVPIGAAPGDDGLTYHSVGMPRSQAGETVELTLAYVKDSDTLSVTTAPPPPVAAAPAPRSAPQSSSYAAVWLGGGALVVLGLGAFAWWRLRAAAAAPAAKRRSNGNKRSSSPGRRAGRAASFCPQCGKPAKPDDRFCHACGNRMPTA